MALRLSINIAAALNHRNSTTNSRTGDTREGDFEIINQYEFECQIVGVLLIDYYPFTNYLFMEQTFLFLIVILGQYHTKEQTEK